MAYAELNRTGCVVHKGNCQIRLGFYLDADDPRYADRYLYLADSWVNTPFHSHFIYLPSTFTEDDIKAAVKLHLPNLYKAFQEYWDEVAGGMRHGWATNTRIKPIDYSKTESAAAYDARVAECQLAIDNLTPFSYKPPEEGVEGQTFPATPIDIGTGAVNGNSAWGTAGYTLLDEGNPANDTGTIDTVEVWANVSMSGTNKVGTFYGSGTSWNDRDYATIGTVTSGAKRTFTGLSIDVATGDIIGTHYTAGKIEVTTSGGVCLLYDWGDNFGAAARTYNNTDYPSYKLSLYGTGETPVVLTSAPLTPAMSAKLIAGKLI